MPEVHFRFGGSTATRTLNCPRWADLSEGMPRGKVSYAASYGTVGHKGFEKMTDSDTYEFADELGTKVNVDGNEVTIDQKLIDKIQDAIDAQEDFFEAEDIEVVHTETLFTHTEIVGGSGDTIAWSKANNVFAVGDLKTGDGHMVFAEDNDQLLFYGWLAVNHFAKDFTFDGNTRIILYIVQPSERRENIFDSWEVNLGDLIEFGRKFELAVRVAEGGLGDPVSGEWCQYCPKAPTCPARNQLVTESQLLDIEGDDMEVLERGMAMVEQVEQWCKDIRALAHEQLELGGDVQGWKLVNRRAIRAWTDEAAALKIFTNATRFTIDEYTDRKFKSGPQMEKVCKEKGIAWKEFAGLVSAVSSGTTLAHADDKRKAVLPLEGLANAVASLT